MTCNLTNMEDLFSRSVVVVHILFLILSVGCGEVTNFGMCKNPECSDPLGRGETTINYNPPEADKLSFGIGIEVKIFSTDAGPKKELLGVEIQGKRGYVPKSMVRETVSYTKNKTLVPAKIKFGAPPSTPRSPKSKPAEEVTHSHSADEPILPANPPADEPVSSSVPSSDEPVPSPDESVLPSGPSPDVPVSSSDPSHDKPVSSSGPTPDEPVSYSGPSPDKPISSSGPTPDKPVSSSGPSPDEPVSSSSPSTDESVPSSPSVPEETNSETDENSLDVEIGVHSRNENEENVVSHGESEPEGQKDNSAESSDIESSKSDESHSSETDSVDISSSDIVPSETFSVSGNSITRSDSKTSDGVDTSSVRDIQHSSDQLRNSDHHVDSVSSTEDVVASISPTGAATVDSYSTKHFEHKHSDSTAVSTDLNSPMPSEPILPSHTEDELQTVSEQLSIAHSQITESLPQAVNTIVESVSSGSLKLDRDDAQQVTQSSFQETHKKDLVVSDEIDVTLALLKKQGINVSDVVADNDVDPEQTAESLYNTYTESQNVEPHNDFHAHNYHKSLHRSPPLVNLSAGLKKVIETIENHSHESEDVLPNAPQQDFPKRNENSGSGTEASEKYVNMFSEDSSSTTSQVLTKTEDNRVDTVFPSDTYSQNDKHRYAGSDVHGPSSQESTSFNGVSRDKKYPSVAYLPVPNHQPKNEHHGLGMSDKDEDIQVHFTNTKNMNSESSVLSTEDFSGITTQSESYVTAKSAEDYSSSTTEATFVSRHLKSEVESEELPDVQYEKQDVSSDSSVLSVSEMFNNSIEGLRSFIEVVMQWLPEPIQMYLLDLQSKGVPPRAAVFTALTALPTILLIISVIYIRQSSKEKTLLVKLSGAEQKLFLATTERDVLKEDIGKLKSLINTLESDLEHEQKSTCIFKKKLEKSENLSQSSSSELRAQLKDLENQVEMKTASVSALQTALEQCKETNGLLQRKLQEEENAVSTISVQLQEFEEEVRDLQKEKEDFMQSEGNYKEKIVGLEQSCNQLLEEAQAWNSRVNELTQQLQTETSCREELEKSVQSKDSEIQSLQNAVMNLQVIQELKNSSDADENTFEEKMKLMLDSSAVQIKLKKAEDERDTIMKSFESERNRVMELEVEMLEAKSEIEKLKLNYNQALQDKTEAQTKLEVLSNYFKDKEMQLQKELGVQEAVRQQKEEDASFAARRVNLIEEENASYKYQVATLKQEIEETERNYKNQVALQEKKAHENWLAARAAERKLEDVKQETAQLRQRLTLMEREQENWMNSSRDEIVRPVPKRPGGPNGEIGAQEINRSKDSSSGSLPLPPEMFPPLRPPILPLDRPLPPARMPMMEPRGFPPPLDPYFDFGPPLPFPPQPWHARGAPPDPLHPLDRRTPSYERGRLTPPAPRRHQSPTISDKDIGRRSASPKEISSRGSHTSSPPHPLPHFHDIPPPPGSYSFRHGPPPPLNSRYPLPPPPRRDFLNHGPGLTRTDSRNSDMITSTPRGAHQLPPAQDKRHQQPSSRV